MRPGIAYGLIRVGVFAVVFAALMLVRADLWWLWALVAAIISLCVGYIFFGRLRTAAGQQHAQRRASKSPSDEVAEDSTEDSQ